MSSYDQRLSNAEAAMNQAQNEYNEAKECFTAEWKKDNGEVPTRQYYQQMKVELKELYESLQSSKETYNLLLKQKSQQGNGNEILNIRQLIEEGNTLLHRRISDLQKPISERMSECSTTKFAAIQRFFSLEFKEIFWDLEGIVVNSGFEWNDRAEDECILDIVSFFATNISDFQFRDSRNISVVVEYSVKETRATSNGKLDIVSLLPKEVATMKETILSQCVCVIEIKTPMALARDEEKCINQSRLQLLALNIGGNRRHPFALLTNVTDYWRFTWLSRNNTIYSVLFTNQNQGLVALQEALQMMNGRSNSCPFTDRCGVNFTEFGGAGGNTEDIADLSDFYDDMTEYEVFQHKTKIGFSKLFQMISPSHKANISV